MTTVDQQYSYNVSSSDLSKGLLHYILKIPATEVNEAIDAEIQERAKNFEHSGFRKGKAPLSLVTQNSMGDIMNTVINSKVNKAALHISTHDELYLVAPVQVNNIERVAEDSEQDEKNTWVIEVVFQVVPSIDLEQISDERFGIAVPVVDFDEVEFQKGIEALAKIVNQVRLQEDPDYLIRENDSINGELTLESLDSDGSILDVMADKEKTHIIVDDNFLFGHAKVHLVAKKKGDIVNFDFHLGDSEEIGEIYRNKHLKCKFKIEEISSPIFDSYIEALKHAFNYSDDEKAISGTREQLMLAMIAKMYKNLSEKIVKTLVNNIDVYISEAALRVEFERTYERIMQTAKPEIKAYAKNNHDTFSSAIEATVKRDLAFACILHNAQLCADKITGNEGSSDAKNSEIGESDDAIFNLILQNLPEFYRPSEEAIAKLIEEIGAPDKRAVSYLVNRMPHKIQHYSFNEFINENFKV